MNLPSDGTPKQPPHRTFSELMDVSAGVFRKGDYGLIEKQALAHRAAAEASHLPAVRAHLTGLAENLETILAAHRER